MKKVSVHIVTFNSEPYIRDCLQAVLQQNYPIDRIIVIDNDSQDGTLNVVREFESDRLTIVSNKVNAGFAGGHNQAIRMAASDYYLVLNPDVTLHPDYVYYLVQRMERDASLGSATGKLLFKHSPNEIDSTGLRFTKSRRAFDRGAGQDASMWDEEGDVIGVSGAAALYSSRMVRDVSIGGEFFDEDFFAYKEDVDVAWRSRLLGWKALYCPAAEAFHNRGWKKGARTKIPLRVRRFSYINRYKMIVKNDHWLYILKHLFPILFYELGSIAYFFVREPGVLGSWRNFFSTIQSTMHKRRVIQGRRKVKFENIYCYFE
ncbi:hypothetical protein YDYSG_59270 [Paenibacillus tyrfis]|uniref:glycosyltransferase family 2 protein n=1 Tax=Paenibacillus tyrfis TaxID=1501230 RepID=UPI0024913849|nr:glycosyltransferase family 2 protein [Paenibacillus tyrfis]GLI09894.1 hypothetical protein YDYSG_59270 [Paenibacillus tyrfis]